MALSPDFHIGYKKRACRGGRRASSHASANAPPDRLKKVVKNVQGAAPMGSDCCHWFRTSTSVAHNIAPQSALCKGFRSFFLKFFHAERLPHLNYSPLTFTIYFCMVSALHLNKFAILQGVPGVGFDDFTVHLSCLESNRLPPTIFSLLPFSASDKASQSTFDFPANSSRCNHAVCSSCQKRTTVPGGGERAVETGGGERPRSSMWRFAVFPATLWCGARAQSRIPAFSQATFLL